MRLLRNAGGKEGTSSPTFTAFNSMKESIVLDLKNEEDRNLAFSLCSHADVVVQTFRPGAMDRLGLGPADIRKVNPKVVYASLSAFGFEEPMGSRGGVDIVLQAECGLMSVTGERGGGPVKVGTPIIDAAAAYVMCLGIVSALLGVERFGKGDDVTVSMMDVGAHLQASPIAEYLASGTLPQRVGAAVAYSAPADVYSAKDGDFVLSAHNPTHWKKLCDVIGRPELHADPRFVNVGKRVENRAELDQILGEEFAKRTVSEMLDLFDGAGMTAGKVRNYEDITNGPEMKSRKSIVTVSDVDGTPIQVVRTPVQFASWSNEDFPRQVPGLGEHGEAIRKSEMI